MVALTAAGQEAARSVAPGHVATVRAAFVDLLDEDEVDVLTAVFERVVAEAQRTCEGADDGC